ncbi:hypothetical protein XENTR_v10005743 [Xenopus tropicalis]|nr:hypothetical protein XENTR_v10005743 [Xenopus tropicalis]
MKQGNEHDEIQTAERKCSCPNIDSMTQCNWPVICVLIVTGFAVGSYLTALIFIQRQQKLGQRLPSNVQKIQFIYSSDDDSS